MTELKRTKRAQRGAGTSKAEAKAAKELLFVDAYLTNGCIGAKAYLQAGYQAKNAHVAAVMANRLLRKPDIAELIRERNQKRLEAANLTANETMASLSRDVKFNPRRLLYAIGAPRRIVDAIDDDTLAALRGVKIDPVEIGKGKNTKIVYRVEVKFPEKTAAREQAMKHFGLYERDNKQKPFYMPPEYILVGVPGRK